MKQKFIKVLKYTLFSVATLALCWFVDMFWGNPVSYLLATRTAQSHLVTTYPGTDFSIDRVAYNFKFAEYSVYVRSPSSVDTHFSLHISKLGKLELDTYSSVLRGFNTAQRLNEEYRTLSSQVFADPSFPYDCYTSYGKLEIHSEEAFQEESLSAYDLPPYAINQSELVLDKIYDIPELGRRAGHLVVYVDSETVNTEQAASVMLAIKERFDWVGLPFAAMTFVLQYTKPHNGLRPEGEVCVAQFIYEDIYEDGMVERVAQADKELKEYYAKLDALG